VASTTNERFLLEELLRRWRAAPPLVGVTVPRRWRGSKAALIAALGGRALRRALAPGGVLIYETFAQGNETVGKPSNPAFLLAPGELLGACTPALRVIAYQDGFLSQPREAFIQRICAVREKTPSVSLARAGNGPENQVLPVARYHLTG
jgi:hypothetical protein